MDPDLFYSVSDFSSKWRASSEGFALDPESEQKRAWLKIYRLLQEYLFLGPNWDGDDAEEPSEAVIFNAISTFRTMERAGERPPVRVLPTFTGGILAEWQDEDYYLEAEFVDARTVEWLEKVGERPAQHWNVVRPEFVEILNSVAVETSNWSDDSGDWRTLTAA